MDNTRQISYWTIGGFEGAKPPEQALAEAKKMGYQGVELGFDGGEFGPGISKKRCKEIQNAAREMDMPIRSLASGLFWTHRFTDERASERKAAIALAKEYLHVAKWVGARVVLMLPGAVAVPWDAEAPVVPYRTAWKNATACIRKLVPVAKDLGVTIGLENVWNWFLADPMAMKAFVDQFKTRRIGVYFDVANCLINGYPQHWIEILGKRIVAVHFKNFSRTDFAGGLHGFGDDLLKGDMDWPAVVAALKRAKYTGPVTAEMLPFSRLPNMVLPDMKLARATAKKLEAILAG
ncbi:MAG TPA: sugar phosphate isomerase/epimerase family protein [Candidatus Hydrogenedentes bacterium]|nr:sugar phosphate isomerase/epimerase family protein [Candidatus Hydrogenedentota bacterium]HPG66879.1 sugar phosphate isomerase/epimerase family protein [Candidatus Hydrogenedentota bacterium]